jgi:hypothetical protein
VNAILYPNSGFAPRYLSSALAPKAMFFNGLGNNRIAAINFSRFLRNLMCTELLQRKRSAKDALERSTT